jgi:hypothetical protein
MIMGFFLHTNEVARVWERVVAVTDFLSSQRGLHTSHVGVAGTSLTTIFAAPAVLVDNYQVFSLYCTGNLSPQSKVLPCLGVTYSALRTQFKFCAF